MVVIYIHLNVLELANTDSNPLYFLRALVYRPSLV